MIDTDIAGEAKRIVHAIAVNASVENSAKSTRMFLLAFITSPFVDSNRGITNVLDQGALSLLEPHDRAPQRAQKSEPHHIGISTGWST